MLLCITFENELLPFMLDMATEEECLKAIERARNGSFLFYLESSILYLNIEKIGGYNYDLKTQNNN
jgi:hypothetical protein